MLGFSSRFVSLGLSAAFPTAGGRALALTVHRNCQLLAPGRLIAVYHGPSLGVDVDPLLVAATRFSHYSYWP